MHAMKCLSHLLAATSSATDSGSSASSTNSMMTVTSLHRYAVKGLSGDALDRVEFAESGDTFPDDRRFALLLNDKKSQKDFEPGKWLHKDNFLCAFSDPELLAQFQSNYEIVDDEGDRDKPGGDNTRRLLTLRSRLTDQVLLDNLDLARASGRQQLADFFSRESGKAVHCITGSSSSSKHDHQFGNTSSGYKQRGDTRTVHIINQATIDELAETLQLQLPFPLQATRFRPNIVVQGAPAWSEFDWVANQQQLIDSESGLTLSIISKTVRCKGVSVDRDQYPYGPVLDIPHLLTTHYPQYGPYLGVYAVVIVPGSLKLGSVLKLQDKKDVE